MSGRRERERLFAQAVFVSTRPHSVFLGSWQKDWQSEWNINTPQPLLLPKELHQGSRDGEFSKVSLPACVSLKCGCMCVCISGCPATIYIHIYIWRCWNRETTFPFAFTASSPRRASQPLSKPKVPFGVILSLLQGFNYNSELYHSVHFLKDILTLKRF